MPYQNQRTVSKPVGMSPRFQAEAANIPEMQEKSLQAKFPGLYARTVQPRPMNRIFPNMAHAADTLGKAVTYKPVKDHELANLDDYTKRAGSLLIATLATLGLKQRIFGVGEFLGFASWFGAMAVTPRIINAMVQLKSGVNLNQIYDSTYGQRQPLFKDPNYLPLQILSDADINRAADKLGIPKNAPNRRQLTEEKMRQVSVQAHTWWMLVAGPATPVISGLVADQLQDPLTRMVNRLRMFTAKGAVRRAAKHPEKLDRRSQAYLDRLIGEIPESRLSFWWKNFGRKLTKNSELKKSLSIGDVVNVSREEAADRMAKALAALHGKPSVLERNLQALQEERQTLQKMGEHAEKFLASVQEKLSPEIHNRQKSFVETRIQNALSTINHYEALFKTIQNGADTPDALLKEVRMLMQKPVLAEVQRMMDTGFQEEALRMVGDAGVFGRLRQALSVRQFGKAFNLMGASPEAHLLTSMKDVMLRRMWQRRIPGMLGGGLLLSTIAYTAFFVGKDFNKGKEDKQA
jgi:hypothetical protein